MPRSVSEFDNVHAQAHGRFADDLPFMGKDLAGEDRQNSEGGGGGGDDAGHPFTLGPDLPPAAVSGVGRSSAVMWQAGHHATFRGPMCRKANYLAEQPPRQWCFVQRWILSAYCE